MKKRYIGALIALTMAMALCAAPATIGAAFESNPPVAENLPPVAENLELCTYRCISVSGRLTAVDPDGDLVTFHISTEPRKGGIQLSEDGTFVYTPDDGKKGKDYFGYMAMDSEGNYSQEATVIIKIEKQKTKVTYSDMTGSGDEYAATMLAEKGVFVGSSVGGEYVFEPGRIVTRGEFLAMCMQLTGADILGGVTRTGFADDSSIPMWIKPYVSTALMSGVISGYSSDASGPVFDSEAPISYSEAAVILNRTLNITDVSVSASYYEEAAVPTWAYQATANLSACRVMPRGIQMSSFLSRSEAASLLLGAQGILDSRG